jgi:hypothetical protein
MTNDEDLRRQQDEREKHSLPGTNQAGKGPAGGDELAHEHAGTGTGAAQDHLEQHSLPGTNQAGKGPGQRNEDETRRQVPD